MAASSDVTAKTLAKSEDFNFLRADVLSTSAGHMHDGTNGRIHIDDTLFILGTSSDIALLNRSTALAADTTLAGVVEGTAKTLATAANSLMIGNVTDDGDVHIVVSKAGNSQTAFLADGSTGDTYINAGLNDQINLTLGTVIEYSFTRTQMNLTTNSLLNVGDNGNDWTATALKHIGSVDLTEMTAPTGTANVGKIFTEDNGSGKTRLMVIFGTGATQQLAIEP